MDIKFGTDGWRGVMAREFTFDAVRRVAQAVADYIKSQPRKPSGTMAVVGYDNRFQSDAYAAEIARILQGNGLPTILTDGPLPTPALSLLSRKLKALGVVVTASHNPATHNGIKIKVDGRPAPEPVTSGVESFLDRANPVRGGQAAVKPLRKDYLDHLRAAIPPAPLAAKLKRPVVIDYMHGSAAGMLGELFKGNKKVVEMRATRDPLFGGASPEPIETRLSALKARVTAEKALIGVALDGDGDRMAVIDDKGRYLTPCQVFPMILEHLARTRGLSKGKVVQSVSLGYLSARVAASYGMEFEELPVGFKHVAERLASGEAVAGAEESGGYAWKGSLPERDGLLTTLLLLEMCAKAKATPSQLWEAVEKKHGKSFFSRVDFTLHRAAIDKAAFTAKIAKRLPKKLAGVAVQGMKDIDGVKISLEGGAWLLMRPSGTEPLVRTYAESDSAKTTKELLDTAAKWVHSQL